jgi:hypothetical protein
MNLLFIPQCFVPGVNYHTHAHTHTHTRMHLVSSERVLNRMSDFVLHQAVEFERTGAVSVCRIELKFIMSE